MNFLAKLILLILYPAAVVLRVIASILGRDPLRLRKPVGESYWIGRADQENSAHYFTETSEAEGHGSGGVACVITPLLRAAATLFKPKETQNNSEHHITAADREEGIPDEVYTLW